MNQLIEYLKQNKIYFREIDDSFIEIGSKKYFLVKPTDGVLFTEDFVLIADENCDRYVYQFGGNWYWEECDEYDKPKLNELKYIGEAVSDISTKYFLGVRGAYEILNGSRLYEDWVKKAKFLGVKSLGICEKNTLAGILKFQLACQKEDVKPIIGATYTVFRGCEDYRYDAKVYVKNDVGWQNILKINKEVLVENNKFIVESKFLSLLDGLFLVIDPKSIDFDRLFPIDFTLENIYYQLDTVEYVNNDRDKQYLNNLKKFVRSDLKPVSITDAFYLDKEHNHIKRILNGISGVREYESENQYFKDKEDYFQELSVLFSADDDDFMFDVFQKATQNERFISNNCNFLIDISQKFLPTYIMSEEESSNFSSNEDLFWYLIEKGLQKFNKNSGDYIDRLEKEFRVINKGGFIDYFLILWDIIKFAKLNNILTGIGRGSAGGSLVAYLLGIIKLNPLEFDLLFERFLNEGRIGHSLPDIDTDFMGSRRNEIKRYMEFKYGINQVCSVGTYTTLKIKAALKELARQQSLSVSEMNYITAVLDLEKDVFSELFKNASQKSVLKKFIQQHSDIINIIPLLLKQPKTASIHACATLILPLNKSVYEWVPVKKMLLGDGEEMIVTEWEGIELEAAGFLKEDILGIKQLDKFQSTIDAIRENYKKTIEIENIAYDDSRVYEYFCKGWNSDVFHFGSKGLTGYCKMLQPKNINDLIAGIALYRPGAMESNFHNEYVIRSRRAIERRNKNEEIEYDFGLEDVTKDTYGLYIYQEQILKACSVLAGMSLAEADDVRRAMGKKKKALIDTYGVKFVEGAKYKGCGEEEARKIWNKLEKFASYGFNKSHAAAYAITGYISQWFKVNYPIEYWSTAFKFSSEDDHANYISEINQIGDIKVMPADVNKSRDDVYTDFESKTIYWPLISIKQCGDKAASQVIEERDKNGEYFSFEEFLSRHKFKGSKVNKQVIENLILAGAFDNVENLRTYHDRHNLIQQYRKDNKIKIDESKDLIFLNKDKLNEDWWWTLQQKIISGIAFFDYDTIINRYIKHDVETIPIEDFQSETLANKRAKVKVGGYITEVEEKISKKGKWCRLKLENNYTFFYVTMWSDQYEQILDLNLPEKEKCLLLLSGEVVYDSYKGENILQTNNQTELIILE